MNDRFNKREKKKRGEERREGERKRKGREMERGIEGRSRDILASKWASRKKEVNLVWVIQPLPLTSNYCLSEVPKS